MKLSISLVILSTLVAGIMAAPSISPENANIRQKRGMVDGVDSAADAVSSNCNNAADTGIAFTKKFNIPGADMIKTGIEVANTGCTAAQMAGQTVLVEGAKRIDEMSGVDADKEESDSEES